MRILVDYRYTETSNGASGTATAAQLEFLKHKLMPAATQYLQWALKAPILALYLAPGRGRFGCAAQRITTPTLTHFRVAYVCLFFFAGPG